MAVSEQLKSLVEQMPDADGRGMYTENIDKEKIEKAVAAIHEGGRENVLGLIDMLAEPGSEEDVKPRYALHCLVNYVLVVNDEAGRRQVCEALASQLGGDRPKYIQAFLCQELGWVGRREDTAALAKLLTDEELSAPASMALAAIREGAAAEFRAAWPKAQGAPRRNIMDGLAALAEPESGPLFQEAIDDEDREVRIAAAAGLASLGDADSAEILLKAADGAEGWERIQATKHCLVLAEKLGESGDKDAARHIYEHLRKTRGADSEQYIREAAERGLAAVG
jgi:HEAT repeat protein